MRSDKAEELKNAITNLFNKLNDIDFSKAISMKVNSDTRFIEGTQVNYKEFFVMINSWYSMIESQNDLNEIVIFVPKGILNSILNNLNDIYQALNRYQVQNQSFVSSVNNLPTYTESLKQQMAHLIPYFKNKNVAKVIKKQWEFTAEKEKINEYFTKSEELYTTLQKREEAINDFYDKLFLRAEEDSEESYSQILCIAKS